MRQSLERSTDGAIRLEPPACHPHHTVQFYEHEQFLAAAVADYLAPGLTGDESALVICTPAHRDAFAARLRAKDVSVERAVRGGRLRFVDAAETMAAFVEDGHPDRERFHASVGALVARTVASARGAQVRAYGEMVDLLWQAGHVEGALRLEELWNELAAEHGFALLCAYAMGNFCKASDVERFRRVCAQHAHVIPVHDAAGDPASRAQEIAHLQQRARALETELAHRRDLELRLREALAAHAGAEEALRRSAAERDELLARERAAREEAEVARAAAEAASQAKSRFLATMSHELRTPLNAIAGHVQLVELGIHGPVTDAQCHALGRVARAQRHLLGIISDVLDYARLEGGRMPYDLRPVALHEVVADVLPLIEPQAREKSIAIDAPAASGDAPIIVLADRARLAQILLNLLSNAVKFTPPHGRVVVESAARADGTEARDLAYLRVTDTGVGIPIDELGPVFEPFVQVGRSYSRNAEGTGLGLPISRDLARGMGGDLRARSGGVGSTFTVTLRRAAEGAEG